MKKKILGLVFTVAMSVGVLAGCGQTAPGSEPTATNLDRADLVLGATTGFFGAESLDVANSWDGWIMSIYGISENLYRLDQNIVPQPWIAESVEKVDDTTWKFTIRDGVTFSNGNTVDAKAVKACFDRTYKMNERSQEVLPIASTEADGMVFTIKTPEPNPSLLNSICDPLLGIYDASEEPDDELGVSCTGPYAATSFVAMTDVQMDAYKGYWGGAPAVDTIELKIIDDQNALDMALQNGEIDLIAQESASSAKLFSDTSKYTTDKITTSRVIFLDYNTKTPGIDDPAVRTAINFCIDRDSFVSEVYQGFASPAYGLYPDTLTFGGTSGLKLTVDKYDIEAAKKLLADAGYSDSDNDGILDKDGLPLSFDLLTYSYNNECLQLTDMLEATLSEVGIDLNIETMDYLEDSLNAGDFDIAVLSHAQAPIGTPSYFIDMVIASKGSANYGKYSNAKVDALAAEISKEADQNTINKKVKELTQQVLDDCAYSFVAHQQLIFVYSNKVKGVEINPTEYYLVTNTMSLAE